MTSRILLIALLCATAYAALVGAAATAQDVVPDATPPAASSTSAPAGAEATPAATPAPAPAAPAAAAQPQPAPASTPAPAATPAPAVKEEPAFDEREPAGERAQAPNASERSGCLEATRRRSSPFGGGLGRNDSPSTTDRDCAPVARVAPKRKPKKAPAEDRPAPTPAPAPPGATLGAPGAAPIGVPNFFIDKFRIPPFLLSIYQAAGIQYGVRWEVLAAINEIETDYGRNLNVSSAGARGWMQFMPSTWDAYGVDANKDGLKDPYNPVDAIFAAARYLRAAGADRDLRRAIFAYNHADWYVDSVLLRARVIGGLPSNFVGSLTGLTQARFPVAAKASYAGKLRRAKRKLRRGANAAYVVEGHSSRRGIEIFARAGAPAIAVNDGRIVRIGETARLGRFVQLQDAYGNTFTYAHLKKVAPTYPAPKRRTVTRAQVRKELELPRRDPKPTAAASDTRKRAGAAPVKERVAARPAAAEPAAAPAKLRLFANPARPNALTNGGDLQLEATGYEPTFAGAFEADPRDFEPKRLVKGARVIAGTILGRIGRTSERRAPHLLFEVRPAGRGAPRIDPKPILDGWKLLESTEIYRAAGKNPFFGPDAETPSIGQILLMGKEALMRRVLSNPRIEIYACGRRDIATGQVDRRVLATLEFLAASGLKPTVTSLRCGHGYYTASGNVSHHSSGNALDIAAVNGTPILGNQGEGSITEMTIQRLLTLQGTMKPDQIISLMTFEGADHTYAMGDHADHIHIGWRPQFGTNSKASKQVNAVLKPKQWIRLIDRLGQIDNPTVREAPSKYAVKVVKRPSRASHAHRGE